MREALAGGWLSMVLEGMMVERQDSKTQFSILSNFYGRGRIIDELNRRGTLAFLAAPDLPAMVDEALGA